MPSLSWWRTSSPCIPTPTASARFCSCLSDSISSRNLLRGPRGPCGNRISQYARRLAGRRLSMKLFKLYAGTTVSLMLLALTIALMIRYQAYLGYVGMGVIILVIIVTGLGIWSVVEKILHRR